MKLAIVGSRDLDGNALAWQAIEDALDRHKPDLLISGGADGIDKMAEESAKARGTPTCIFYPEGKTWPAFRARNILIAEGCSHLVRIYSDTTSTYGSGFTADWAKMLGKYVELIKIETR
jgi:predicted Rossmann fold nucleotide-binding protein DprA/Smf involved in DNA uptake